LGLPGKKIINYVKMVLGSKRLMDELKAFKPDLIHVHGSTMHGMMAKRIAKKLGIPFVVSEHTGPYSKISEHPVFKSMSKTVIEASASLFSVSKDLEDQILRSGITPKSKTVTFNPVDTDLFTPGNHSNEFVFVGRYESYKGALRVLKAFSKIEKQLPDWRLRLIGGGKEFEPMMEYVTANGLEHRVQIHGQMNKPQIAEHLKRAGVFVFPSEHETFGIVIAEGMSCGLPVVVGDRTAPKEFVGSEHGVLVDPTDIDAISEGMLQVARPINKYDRKLIRQYVESKFGFTSFGEMLVAEYRNVLQS
jgi:glycosyltransferase involved in cell wall biosynthesis